MKKNPENRVGLPDNTAMICYKFVLNFVYYLIFKQCENIVSKIQFGEKEMIIKMKFTCKNLLHPNFLLPLS